MVVLAHEEAGEGEPWVLLHGFPLTRRLWDPQRRLADRARLLVPDLRGFGGSPFEAPLTMDAMAEDVLALCDRAGAPRVGVVGLSMGGYVALAMARRAPERVRALVLADTQAGDDPPEARARREELAKRLEAEGIQVLVRDFMLKLLSPAGRDDPDLVGKLRAMVLANDPEAMAAALRGMAVRADQRPFLRDLRCPVLVVAGGQDEVIPVARAREIAEAVPGARLAVVPGAGHLTNLEDPAAFNEALGAFLEASARAAPPGRA